MPEDSYQASCPRSPPRWTPLVGRPSLPSWLRTLPWSYGWTFLQTIALARGCGRGRGCWHRAAAPSPYTCLFWGQAETLLAGPELGLHLERVLCRPAPVQPRRSWTWAVGGREEGRPPPRLAAHKPFHPPSGSRLPFPPAQPCCNCIPGIALRGPPLPLGPSCGGGWETHTAGTRCFGQTYPRLT